MTPRISRSLCAALVLALSAWLAACEGSTAPEPEIPASIVITPRVTTLAGDDTMRLTATILTSDGRTVAGRVVAWRSSKPFLVAVDSTGLARGSAMYTGSAKISATIDSLSDTITIQVVHRLLAADVFAVWPDTNLLVPGMTRQLVARAQTEAGGLFPVADVRWSSTDESVLRVDSTGTVTVLSTGRGTVVATVGAREARAQVYARTYVPPLQFTTVATGRWGFDDHACALAADGTAYCWGAGSGLGTSEPMDRCEQFAYAHRGITYWARNRCAYMPVRVQGGEPFVGISVDYYSNCAWTATGTTYCWGDQPTGGAVLLGGGVAFSVISRKCGIGTNELLYCWGDHTRDRLGMGPGAPSVATPQRVKSELRWRSVSASPFSSACAVATDGRAFCWGWNPYSSLGVVTPDSGAACSTTECVSAPTEVATPLRFTDAKKATEHACGLTADGQLFCWGGSYYARAVPVTRVTTDVRLVSLNGEGEVCGMTAAGEAHCVSFNDRDPAPSFTLVPVAAGTRFRTVDPGRNFSCGIALDGMAYCIGSGPLGDGELRRDSVTPVLVAGQR